MTDVDSRIQQARVRAAEDLRIVVDRNGVLSDDDGDVLYLVLVRGFGGPEGCAIPALGAVPERFASAAKSAGAFPSVLSEAYADYDRALFVDTLSDWGWFGPGEPPTWYSGRPWGS